MYAELGAAIRSARERAGLDQIELARRLSLGQQAVSGWERGRSRPRRPMLRQVADVLGVSEDELVDLGFYAVGNAPQGDEGAARPLARTLPISSLTPDRFEDLTVEIMHAANPGAHATRFGGPGEKQHGIDVLVAGGTGENLATAQCKRQLQFGAAAVARAVEEVTIKADQHHLFLSRAVASPGARQEMGNYPGWRLWDGEDISRFIRTEMQPDRAVRLVDTYFPGHRESFLGVARPGPWLTPEDAFQVAHSQLFTQDWRLVGRSDELQRFAAGLYEKPRSLMLLSGRGGIGKTRLLRAVAEAAPDAQTRVLVLNGGQPVAPADYELLPGDGPLLVLIDDAHEFDAVSQIVAGVWRRNTDASILLVTRPYRWEAIRSELGRAGVRPDAAATVQLDDLKPGEAEELAREALGDQADDGVVQRLARVTLDCPLVTVVGGVLIRLGRLDPAQLEQDDEIRTTIMERFRDALVADPLVTHPATRSAVIDATAAFQPVRTDDQRFQATMTTVVGKPWDVIERHLRGLEDAGVIRRRGTSIRIVPDLLGDVVLAQACWNRHDGTSTGYLDRVRKVSDGQPLQHLFINACRIDWQVRRQAGSPSSLIDELWELVENELKAGDIPTRRGILQILTRVSYFQPERAIALARWIIENPTDDPGPEDASWPFLHIPTYQDVLNDLSPVVKNAAYTFETLPDALDLLWQLAQTDDRPTNQIPDHPLRALTDLADYQIGKPAQFNDAIIDVASRWFDSVGEISPFAVLRSLLATEGSHETYQEFALTFQPFSLNVDVVAPIRDRVVGLALAELTSSDVRRAAEAADTLEAALHYPMGMFGRAVPDEERERWTPLFVDTINQIRAVLTDHDPDPVVLVAVQKALHWHANHSSTATKAAARDVIAALRAELPDRVALIIHDGWGHLLNDDEGDFSTMQARVQARLSSAVATLMELEEAEALTLIVERLSQQRRAFGPSKGSPGPLISEYVKARPAVATPLIDLVVSGEAPALEPQLPVILATEAELDPRAAVARANELLSRDDRQLTLSVAQALSWNRGRRQLEQGELQILLGFATHPDVAIRQAPVTVGQRLVHEDLALACELLLAVDFSDAPSLADEVFMAFSDAFGLTWETLSEAQQEAIRDRLVKLSDIGQHWIEKVLSDLSAEDPGWVIELLQRRVRYAEGLAERKGYRPTPLRWNYPLRVREDPAFATHIKRLHAWLALDSTSWIHRHYGAEIFSSVAGQYDDTVLTVLTEALRSTEPRDVLAVATLVGKAHTTLIWDEPNFVRTALAAAARIGPEGRDRMVNSLWAATISGMRTGTPGQPFPQDIEQRDRSMELAQSMPLGSIERRFYEDMAESAEANIRRAALDDLEDGHDW
jgi:transcriptional regulator with XRE-family HTH domain